MGFGMFGVSTRIHNQQPFRISLAWLCSVSQHARAIQWRGVCFWLDCNASLIVFLCLSFVDTSSYALCFNRSKIVMKNERTRTRIFIGEVLALLSHLSFSNNHPSYTDHFHHPYHVFTPSEEAPPVPNGRDWLASKFWWKFPFHIRQTIRYH